MHTLKERESLSWIKIAEIRRLIEESRRHDRSTPADEVLSRLEAKYIGMSENVEAQGSE